MFPGSGSDVEQRGLAAVGVAYQRYIYSVDGAVVGGVSRHILVGKRACVARRAGGALGLTGGADAYGAFVRHGRGGLRGLAFGCGIFVGNHFNKLGLAAPQRHLVAENPVFYRVTHRGGEHGCDAVAFYEAHFHHSFAEGPVAEYFYDSGRLAGLQI